LSQVCDLPASWMWWNWLVTKVSERGISSKTRLVMPVSKITKIHNTVIYLAHMKTYSAEAQLADIKFLRCSQVL